MSSCPVVVEAIFEVTNRWRRAVVLSARFEGVLRALGVDNSETEEPEELRDLG
jgi:hypothetical protein